MTEADLESLDAAILALARGERVAEARIEGQWVRYADIDLPQLRALRADVAARVAGTRGARISYATQTGKGL